jgi:uncharacterized protein (DUF885 family)
MAEGDLARVTKLADTYVKEYFDVFPYQAIENGAPDFHPDRLGDHSLAALKRWQDREDTLLKELRAIPVSTIENMPQAVTYKVLQNQLEAAQAYRACRMELWNVSPTSGWQAEFAVVAGLQATVTDEDRSHALARFSEFPGYIDAEIENLREGLRLGYRAPRHNVELVIGQLDAMLVAPLAESPFVQIAKSGAPLRFRQDLEALEKEKIRPAIARYRAFLKETYLAAARNAIGMSANPGGIDSYAAAIRYYTTVNMAPQEAHDLGKSEMERIHAEIRDIGKRRFGIENPVKLLAAIKSDPKYRFKSRDELLKDASTAVKRARQALPRWFGNVPQSDVVIEPFPPYMEKSGIVGQSVAPTADGKPGKYLINASNPTEQNRAGMEAMAFHETFPGHLLQRATEVWPRNLHPISRYFFTSGFGEGWGTYAERLADEMKLYSSDVDIVGMLSTQARKAAFLVVDSGMHALGWTREQAIDYMLVNTTDAPSRATAFVDRCIAGPGQATSYLIGFSEIRRLRSQAEESLGNGFNVKEFHDMLLRDGTIPLWMARQKVERWIAEKRAA